MAAHVFGQGVHHDICTMLDRAQQIGAWDRVINDQWDAVVMGHFGKGRNVRDIAQGVANRLAVNGLGFVINVLGKAGWIARVSKAHFNALLRKGVRKQVVSAAVKRAGRNDVVPGFGDGLNGVGDGRHA